MRLKFVIGSDSLKRSIKPLAFILIFTLMAITILLMQYFLNYDLRKQPPSVEWSKEVPISLGTQNEATKPFPRIIGLGSDYVIAHQNNAEIKLVKTDSLGKVLIEKSIVQKDNFIKYINLLSDGSNLFLYVVRFEGSGRTMYCYKLDKDLIEQNTWTIDNVDSTAQIGNNILIVAYNDKIEIKDLEADKTNSILIKGAKLVAGTKINDKIMISYHEKNKFFKYFYLDKNFSFSDVKTAGLMAAEEKGYFERANLACDEKFGYILVDAKSAGDRYGVIRYLKFELNGVKAEVKEFRQYPFSKLYSPIAVSSGEEARFIAGSTRQFGKKAEQYDIVEFYMKDGIISHYSIASRTKEPSVYPAIYNDTVIFMDPVDKEYRIFMASKAEEFKNANNYLRPYESSRAWVDTANGFVFSLSYLLIFGIRWIIVGIMLIATVCYFSYYTKDSTRVKLFTISYLITVIAKLYAIYSFFYVQYSYMIPDMFKSPILGLAIGFIISIPCYIFAVGKYKQNLEAIPFASFSYGLIIDSILTQMIFIPFIA